MNAERSRAYARVMTIVADLSAAKLHADEQAVIREAADALLFCSDLDHDDAASQTLDRLVGMIDRLVSAERVMPETGEAILDAVEACGPDRVAA